MAQGIYTSLNTKSPVKQMTADIATQAMSGLAGIAGGMIGSGKRKREQRDARAEMSRMKADYMNLDTSNLAANMENTYEDLTVNTQAADMANQQSQQNMANIMGNLGGAAGAGGIAAMAQQLAQTGNQFAQSQSAQLGQQEQALASQKAGAAMSIQNAEIAGAQESRSLEKDKVSTLLGMSQQRVGAANAARRAATEDIIGGVGNVVGAGAQLPQWS